MSECSNNAVIAERAYFKWLNAGFPPGDGREFWFAAEKELTHSNVALEEVVEVEVNGYDFLIAETDLVEDA